MIALARDVGAFQFLVGSKDAAMATTLGPSIYSAQVFDASNANGETLVEVYDTSVLFTYSGARLLNVSARATVTDVMIAGFAIKGTTSVTVLLRGIGPALGQFGVTGALVNPGLAFYLNSTLVTANDNWAELGAATITNAAASVGAFALPANSLDAAILATLQPGAYTLHVTGVANTTGIALIEVYEVP